MVAQSAGPGSPAVSVTTADAAAVGIGPDDGGFAVEQWGFGDAAIDYRTGLARQRATHARVVSGEPGVLALLEHRSVYTLGRSTRPADLPLPGARLPTGEALPECVEADRGGRITWHGPGQLVGYPILPLREPIDVIGFVRELEAGLIEVCASLGVAASRVAGRSGVWLAAGDDPPAKLAAIGVRVARGVTMHGFALNCDNSLDAFTAIVPCGLSDAGVTTLSHAAARTISVTEATTAVLRILPPALSAVALPRHRPARTQRTSGSTPRTETGPESAQDQVTPQTTAVVGSLR